MAQRWLEQELHQGIYPIICYLSMTSEALGPRGYMDIYIEQMLHFISLFYDGMTWFDHQPLLYSAN